MSRQQVSRPVRARVLGVLAAGLLAVTACAETDDATPPATDLPELEGTAAPGETLAPADTTPADTTPGDTTPGDTTPGDTTPDDTAPSATDAPVVEALPAQSYAAPGPYLSGVTTLDLGDRQAEVWYPVDPADVEGASTEIFDTLSVFPESLKDLIPSELTGEVDTRSFRDAAVSLEAPFPVVVYSHGFGGYRQVATAYTSHLASWGFIVVSTDHLERGIAAQATGSLQNIPGQDVRDVRRSLDALEASPLGAAADLDNIGITGHSAGAGTAARSALELDRIDAMISIAGGAPVVTTGDPIGAVGQIQGTGLSHTVEVVAVTDVDATLSVDGAEPVVVPLDALSVPVGDDVVVLQVVDGETLTPGTITIERKAPAKPSLVVIAELDEVVVPASSNTLFRLLDSPRYRVEIEQAGHNSFTDSCVGIRELGGLGSLTDLLGEAQVARAEDGCTEAFVDPTLATSVLGHYSVAFLRTTLGVADDSATLAVDITPELGGIALSAFDVQP
jgi:dienelactone hydrolase